MSNKGDPVREKHLLLKLVHHNMFERKWEKRLKEIATMSNSNSLAPLRLLKSLVPYVISTYGLKNLIYLFVKSSSDMLEKILKDITRSSEALQIVKEFWALCFSQQDIFSILNSRGHHIPHEGHFSDLVDVLPSLASVYIDLTISVHCMKEKVSKVSKKLYSSLTFELNSRCLKTALLEVTLCSGQGAKVIMPLLQKVLFDPLEDPDHLDYLLHTVLLRRWTAVCDQLAEDAQNVKMVRAPHGFLDWLSHRWSRASEYFPLDKSCKGRRVTEVMMSLDQAALEELIDVFSHCLWSDHKEDSSGESRQEVAMETDQSQQLFVIDKKGSNTVTDTEKEFPKMSKRASSGGNHEIEVAQDVDQNSRKKRQRVSSETNHETEVSREVIENSKKKVKRKDSSQNSEEENEMAIRLSKKNAALASGERQFGKDEFVKGGGEGHLGSSGTVSEEFIHSEKKSKVRGNEFIDLSDAEEESQGEGKDEEVEENENEESGSGDDDDDDDDDDDETMGDDGDKNNESDDDGEGDAMSEDERIEDGGSKDVHDPSSSEEEEEEEEDILHTDSSTVYTYRKNDKSPAKASLKSPPREVAGFYMSRSPGGSQKEKVEYTQAPGSCEPRTEEIDGMQITVYDTTVEPEPLGMEDTSKPEGESSKNPVEDVISESLKSIRNSIPAGTRRSQRLKSLSESDTGDSRVEATADVSTMNSNEVKKEKASTLSDWMRSPKGKSEEKFAKAKASKSPVLSPIKDEDKDMSAKPQSAKRKSASDFFEDANSGPSPPSLSPKGRFQSPLKGMDTSSKKPKSPRIQMSQSLNLTSKECVKKSPSPEKKMQREQSTPVLIKGHHSSMVVTRKDLHLEDGSPSGEFSYVFTKTPEGPSGKKKTPKSEPPRKDRKKGSSPKRIYYLRNPPMEAAVAQSGDSGGSKKKEKYDSPAESSPTKLKRKRTKSEPSQSPKKSPMNRRQSLRSATTRPKVK